MYNYNVIYCFSDKVVQNSFLNPKAESNFLKITNKCK